MKKHSLYSSMGVIMLLLTWASCTEEITNVHSDGLKQIVITAPDFETEVGSRTNFQITNAGAEFSWAANDTVGIFPSEGAQAYFPMTSGAGTKTANFNGGGWALKDASTYAAYYPFIGDFYLDKNAVPVDYSGQIQTGDAFTTHLGAYDYMVALPAAPKNGLVNFAFKHLGALVQLKLTIPQPATVNSVTLTTDDEVFTLKGRVNIMAENAVIESVDTSNEMTLTVENVTTTEANQIVTLYMMISPVDLSSKTLKAVVRTTSGNENMILQSKNFQAGKAYALSNDMVPSQTQAGYYQISNKLIEGWDEGIITSDKHYFVVKADSTIDGYVCYMNDSINSTKGMAVYLDKEFNATKFLFSEGVFLIERNLNAGSAYLCFIDSTGNIVIEKEVELSDETRNVVPLATRSVGDLITKSIKGFEKGYDYLGKLGTLGDFVSGDWDGVKNGLLTDCAAGAIGGIVGGLPGAIVGVLISEIFRNLQNMGNDYHDEAVKILLGSSEAKISSIERTGIYTYLVKVNVTDLATRNNQIDVQVGLYIRENFSTINDKYKTYSSDFYSISSDGTVEFTVNVGKANGHYFVAPILLPYRQFSTGGNVYMSSYNKYGKVKRLEGDVFDIQAIIPTNCTFDKDSKDYNFNVQVSASILCPDDVASWGIDLYVWRYTASMNEIISEKIGTITYPLSSSAYTLKFEGHLPASFLNAENKQFSLRAVPYAVTLNNEQVEGDPKTFIVKVSGNSCPDATPGEAIDLGLSVKWASHNVGASSPEAYGGYYAWGETEEKSDYDWDTYKYYNNSTGDFDYIGSNISGTQYDVAHVKWGGSWRMPTANEFEELVSKCSWKWTTYNGVNGRLVTGPNGNSIFLPAAGYRYGTGLHYRGSYGYYWSAALYELGSSYAYFLYFYDGYYDWYGWGGRDGGLPVRPVTE